MPISLTKQGSILFQTGLDSSIPAEYINENASPNNKNFTIDRGVLLKRNGTVALGATLGEEVKLGTEFIREGTRYNIRIGKTSVEKYNVAGTTWDDITGVALTGDDDDYFDIATPLMSGKEILCITNGVDNIRKWTASGNTTDLGGTPPKAKYIQEFKTYLVCGNITGGVDVPQRIQWSDTADPETWTGGNTGSVDLVEEGDRITGLSIFGDYLAVHKPSAIYLGYLVSSSSIFKFDRINTGVGAICNCAIANIPDGRQVFLAEDGIRIFNGTSAPRIDSRVNDELRKGLNQDVIQKSWALTVPEKDEVWLAVAIGAQTTPDTIYKYNYQFGFIYKDERANTSSAWRAKSSSSVSWDEMTGTWDDQTGKWNDGALESDFPVINFGDSSGIVTTDSSSAMTDNSTAIEAFYETKDFIIEEGQIARWLYMELWAKGNQITIEYSVDKGNSWQPMTSSPYTLTNFYPSDTSPLRVFFDEAASTIRFRFTNNENTGTLYIKRFIIAYKPRELRING